MDLGLYIAASGMVAEQARQDQLANDLANASTPGFKPDQSTQQSFGELLIASGATGQDLGTVSTEVQSGKAYTNLAPSGIHETGQPLDFAIAGEGFFAVSTPAGVRYTRDGQFTVSAAGLLTDASGNDVLSQTGATIKVKEGHIAAAALGAYNVKSPEKQGENLFSGTPEGRASGTVHAGALEESGVDAVTAMVEMMASLRNFQSGQQAIQAIGGSLQEAAAQVGTIEG